MNDNKKTALPKKAPHSGYKVFVLQTDEDGKRAMETRDSIKRYEKDFNVMIIKEPYGLEGVKGLAAVPLLINFNGEAIVVTDQVLCIGNFAPLFFNKPTISFAAGLSYNVCLVQPWGGDPLDIHWHFSEKYLDLYRKNTLSIFEHIKNNYDFSDIFKYRNPPPSPKIEKPKEKPSTLFQADAKRSPAVAIEPEVNEEKPKKKGWFR
jgi:hypothetical protein